MLAKERAKIWATDPHFDEKTQEAAAQMLENEEELLSAFGTELAFGTGGLRGVLGVGTDRMNEYTVGRATQGLADYLREKDGKSVAIGYDSRLRSREFAYFAAGVLARNGLTAHVYPRLMPTPMLSFAVRELGCDAGIVITASHNPAQYNGYKAPTAARSRRRRRKPLPTALKRFPTAHPSPCRKRKAAPPVCCGTCQRRSSTVFWKKRCPAGWPPKRKRPCT